MEQSTQSPAHLRPSTSGRLAQEHHFRAWLLQHEQHELQIDKYKECFGYRKHIKRYSALPGSFSLCRPEHSAHKTLTRAQRVILGFLLCTCLLAVFMFQWSFLTLVMGLITLLYILTLALSLSLSFQTALRSDTFSIDEALLQRLQGAPWPSYTILCPLYRESAVLPQLVQALLKLDYPVDKLQILLLVEKKDRETREALKRMHLPEHFEVLVVPAGRPRTKPRACNYGLMWARGHYIVIYDAEDIPDLLQLKKAALTFAVQPPEVACVQAKLSCYNASQNLLTRWYAAEYAMWFHLILPGLQRLGLPVPLGGTSNHFRTADLRSLGGWDAYNVTEDCDVGLRLARRGLRTVMIDSTTEEEATSKLLFWLRQRSRWIKGYMQTYFVHIRQPGNLLRETNPRYLLVLNILLGSSVTLLFFTPLMWILSCIYFLARPSVEWFYQQLFPAPIFYPAFLCFVFGNFYYVLLYMYGCMRKEHYQLIPWTLGILCYWALTWLAAFIALYELLREPHYWQKTAHGFHLVSSSQKQGDQRHRHASKQRSAIKTSRPNIRQGDIVPYVPAPPFLHRLPEIALSKQESKSHLWLRLTLISAIICSSGALLFFLARQETLLYADALSHLRIARKVFDSLTPGLAQLGTVWLPFHHILMFPFIWNDTLWHTGLAGSLVSMCCYVATALALYHSAHRLTGNQPASCLGTLCFLLNPNILYLQTTPLSELVCICTSTIACACFLVWIQSGRTRTFLLCALATNTATASRYDGWFLFILLLPLIALICWKKRYSLSKLIGHMTLFLFAGGFSILLWFLWNAALFGDPLEFQHGAFSAQTQHAGLIQEGVVSTFHNLSVALQTYLSTIIATIGPVPLLLAGIAILFYCIQHRRELTIWALLPFFAPLPFYTLALYNGQAVIYIPGTGPTTIYNVRYGAAMVVPVALALALFIDRISAIHFPVSIFRIALCIVIVLSQPLLLISQGVITLYDGQYGYSCQAAQPAVRTLLRYYQQGERILLDEGAVFLPDLSIALRNFVGEGNRHYWERALLKPEKQVTWVLLSRRPQDRVARRFRRDAAFHKKFTLLHDENGLQLYPNNAIALHQAPRDVDMLLAPYKRCTINLQLASSPLWYNDKSR